MKNKALDANLDFDGMAGDGVNREKNRFAGNYAMNECGVKTKENFGTKTVRGGIDTETEFRKYGTSATKDKFRHAPVTAREGKIDGGATVRQFGGSPDSINVGK